MADEEAKPGDVWEDLDPRRKGRQVKILAVPAYPSLGPEFDYATVRTVADSGGVRTHIAMSRLRTSKTGKSGFRLVSREVVSG